MWRCTQLLLSAVAPPNHRIHLTVNGVLRPPSPAGDACRRAHDGLRMKRAYWLYLIAIVSGAAIWIFVALATGRNEAWDSGLYFSVGIPAVCVVSMALAFFEPEGSWRWGILPLVGQFLWMLFSNGPGNLLPLGIVVFAVLSVPSIIAARIGASIARRWAGPSEP